MGSSRCTGAILQVRNLTIDTSQRRCWKDNIELDLADLEFDILVFLARQLGRMVSGQELRNEVWGERISYSTFYDRIAKLRKKIGPELLTTIRGLGCRLEIEEDLAVEQASIQIGGLVMHTGAWRCWKDGTELNLSKMEFGLLRALARRTGKVISKEALKEEVWGAASEYLGDAALTMQIANLRRKIDPALITVVRNGGYRLELLQIGDLTIDPQARRCWRAGTELNLNRIEFGLLLVLAQHAGELVGNETLKTAVWGKDGTVSAKKLATRIANLRKKLGSVLIVNVQGRGYYLASR